MDLFGVLTMIGGLAMFLYGMNEMGDGLAKLAGGKLEKILEKLTSKRIMAVLLGVAVTAVIQSSSATTVMVVGFVNSGIMQLSQAVGIIMGANVGTTVTSWLLSLTGIEGSSFFIQLLKPSSFAPVLAAIGIIMTMTAKDNNKKKDIGNILIGFAILMFGMETMSGAVEPLAENEKFTGILTMFSNPLLGVLAGLALTAIIQSSSASVGILQALCMTGAVSYATAIPIIMGQNIGTCVTALISSIGAKRNAKRASMIHLYFNMIGTILFFVVFYSANALVGGFRILGEPANAAGIAIVHSLFNIGSLVVLYPFADKLVRLAQLTIPETPEEKPQQADEFARLDERFLEKPGFAMELCRSAAIRMAQEAREALDHALDNMREYSDDTVDKVIATEGKVPSVPQQATEGLHTAPKIFKETCFIPWQHTAKQVYDFVRGLSPYPGAWSALQLTDADTAKGPVNVKLFRTAKTGQATQEEAGTLRVDNKRLYVACADQWLEILELQAAGKKRMASRDFLNGMRWLEQHGVCGHFLHTLP